VKPEILKYPNEVLTKPCKGFLTSEPESILTALSEALMGVRGEYLGVGLAAPQIGISEPVCIIRYEGYKMDLVNPRIVNKRGPITVEPEGCLSIDNRIVDVPRWKQITIEADNFGGQIQMNDPIVARIIQHEVDHLQGIIIINYNKIGRNDPCPCGSGKKYKKCCGK